MAEAVDDKGRLIYGAANICNHYISLQFLTDKILPNISGTYHLATKKIPYMDPVTKETVAPQQNNGVKLEMFIFDVFPLAERWLVMEVAREDEFAPVKNAPGDPTDSPDTARKMISEQGVRWLRAAGATVIAEDADADAGASSARALCEVSPLLSYAGEGLEKYAGKEIKLPAYLE
jgi:UDP-N-acetylglucosamine/UDP-N-acetylgalactosamine diphosphorylase